MNKDTLASVSAIAIRAILFIATLLTQTSVSAASQRAISLIDKTPCLFEYRMWLFTSYRRPPEFKRPEDFTEDQCLEAKRLNDEIESGLHDELLPEEIEAARRKSEIAEQQASIRGLSRREAARNEELERRKQVAAIAKAKAEKQAQARLPPPSIGMSATQARTGTNWGRLLGRRSTTTASGVVETWTFWDNMYLTIVNGTVAAINE